MKKLFEKILPCQKEKLEINIARENFSIRQLQKMDAKAFKSVKPYCKMCSYIKSQTSSSESSGKDLSDNFKRTISFVPQRVFVKK